MDSMSKQGGLLSQLQSVGMPFGQGQHYDAVEVVPALEHVAVLFLLQLLRTV